METTYEPPTIAATSGGGKIYPTPTSRIGRAWAHAWAVLQESGAEFVNGHELARGSVTSAQESAARTKAQAAAEAKAAAAAASKAVSAAVSAAKAAAEARERAQELAAQARKAEQEAVAADRAASEAAAQAQAPALMDVTMTQLFARMAKAGLLEEEKRSTAGTRGVRMRSFYRIPAGANKELTR